MIHFYYELVNWRYMMGDSYEPYKFLIAAKSFEFIYEYKTTY